MTAAQPPGYPSYLETVIELAPGQRFRVRPILPSDAAGLADEIRHADSRTLYMRFFTPHLRLDEERIRYLTTVDYIHRLALVVLVDQDGSEGEGVAIGRYEGHEGSDIAEIAVTVKRGWRQLGLGQLLVEMLESAARTHGITSFDAMYLAGNDGAAGLMKATGFSIEQVDAGVVTVHKDFA